MIRAVDASEKHLGRWDECIEGSVNGTLFHKRAFLAYHGNRFADAECPVVVVDGEEPIGWMPLAVFAEEKGRIARSPYGASYGGIALGQYPTYSQSRAIVSALVEYLVDRQVDRCLITPPIAPCSRYPVDTFTFALIEGGFRSVKREISSVMRLGDDDLRSRVTSRARNAASKAERSGVEILRGVPVEDFDGVFAAGYEEKGRNPTHSAEELGWLVQALPESIRIDIAVLNGRAVAGAVLFAANRRVNSSFYLCQDPEFADSQAMSLLLIDVLEQSRVDGFAWFDFGTSTVDMQPRENIFRFKESFSPYGVFRESFEWTPG